MDMVLTSSQVEALRSFFGEKLLEGEQMSRYSVMQVGGPADFLVKAGSLDELESATRFLWEGKIPFLLLGGGPHNRGGGPGEGVAAH